MKFSDYINENKNNNIEVENKNIQNIENNFNDIFNKYKDYSKGELINEFLKLSEERKNNGKLDGESAQKIKEILNPYLNEDQNDMLKNLLNMVINDN